MTRQPHDQFAKQYLAELLASLGQVEISREIIAEVQQADIFFIPTPQLTTNLEPWGLLGRMVATSCLLEPFRNQPSKTEIRSCLLKLFSLQSEFQRRAKREDVELPETNLPQLWILATSASTALIESFGAKLELANWPRGVYFFPPAYKTAIISINQLPSTPETLWIRLLGKGKIQRKAIGELISLPPEHPLRGNILELISIWRLNLETQANLTEDERELFMILSTAFEKLREELLQQGRQEGRQEGIQQNRRELLESLLSTKFGTIDPTLAAIIESLSQLPPAEFINVVLALPSLEREQIIARFGNTQN
jgi:hypothetical protein